VRVERRSIATSGKMVAMFDDVEGVGDFTVSKNGGHGVYTVVGGVEDEKKKAGRRY
jgi:hypothetical protein